MESYNIFLNVTDLFHLAYCPQGSSIVVAQDFLLFCALIIFHSMHTPHFPYQFLHVHVGCFHFLDTVNKSAMNMCVQVFLQNSVFNYFGYIPRVGLLAHMIVLPLIF